MNRIRELRESKGLKQKDLAEKVGLSTPSISYYERGRKKPSMNNAFKIAQALDTTIDGLFFGNVDKKEKLLKGGDPVD